ncbi:maleylacetoacetate isomerase [Photobacterium makurazakiensis]|uniref:maleylacetoacetate isomerase n=1 Tax=Photobacterium makurazakiensis TaxID=2910234 RepID=UPI003D141F9D
MKLYDYYRSSAAYRVRIALNLKQLDWECVPVSLLKGEQSDPSYTDIAPAGLVPALDTGEHILTQSLAICEYLDEVFTDTPSILPSDALARAQCRSLAYQVGCDIHPLNNLRVLKYLKNELRVSDEQKTQWYHHWLHKGFTALEQQLKHQGTPFCCGDTPTLADICLIPQMYNAKRFNLPLSDYPTLVAIDKACNELNAFITAHPDNSPQA